MNSTISQLAATTMRPPQRPGNPRGGMPEETLDILAAMPAATDKEAGCIAPPVFTLTDREIESVNQAANAWRASVTAATLAEQAAVAAERLARRLPELQRHSGEQAARALALNGSGRQLALQTVADLDAAANAAEQLPILSAARDIARDRVVRLQGVMHATAVNAIQCALKRAVTHFNAASLEMTRAVAAISAAVSALPRSVAQPLDDGVNVLMRHLLVPALPPEFGPQDRAAAPGRYTSTMLDFAHPRLSAHRAASAVRLDESLREALGFSPSQLLHR
jgi:hypothetical protein